MDQKRILFRRTMRRFDCDTHCSTTVSFIPVCDNCNYVFERLDCERDEYGGTHFTPIICPNCGKYIDCARMPLPESRYELHYEEN